MPETTQASPWNGLPDRRALIRRWHDEGAYGQENLARAMDRGAALYGDSETVFYSETRPGRAKLSELYARSLRLAGALYSLGLRQGDVIAIQVPNWIEGMLAYQAAMQLGAVMVPIIHIYGPKEVSFILASSGAKFFIVPDRWRNIDYIERLAKTDLGSVEKVIVIGQEAPAGAMSWPELEALETDDFPRSTALPDDPCVMVYTSGTTSSPKGVVHSHNTLIAANRMYVTLGDMDASTVTLGSGPAGHIGGVINVMKLFLTGSSTIMLDAWDAQAAARMVREYGITQTNGTPYFLSTMLDASDALGVPVSGITRYMVGGASVPPSLIERAEGYGIWSCRAYGSTEVFTATSAQPDDPLEKRAYTDGRANPGAAIRIVDDAGKEVATGEEGEVAIMAPFMFLGYSDAAANRTAFTKDGWFLSGDIGRLDGEGFLTITDRKKDIIIRGGENISSKEVEDVLATHPAVFESAVTALPDEVMGERVCAFVVLRGQSELTLDDVREHFRAAGIARPKTPEKIVIIDEFPRTAAGKVKKFELRERLKSLVEA
jgi:acyl-CoA synthetase (AMP-forming)/AMP-acid ligase II